MKKILKIWTETTLILKIGIGVLIGVILALTVPGISAISMLGTLFVGALKAIAPILVLALVMRLWLRPGKAIVPIWKQLSLST